MSLELFHFIAENPNQISGGGGCLCSETVCGDGPYAVFPASEMASNISPHAVVCSTCLFGLVDGYEKAAAEGAEVAA